MEALAPSPEPQPPVVVTSTTTTRVMTAQDTAFTTTTTVTVPQTLVQPPPAAAPIPLDGKAISVDVAKAEDVKNDAPATPNTMTRSPFERVFDPMKERSDDSLRDFLVSGGCDCTGWEPDVFSQLRNELEKGEATLGVDAQGSVKRVVSVAKPIIFDGTAMLVEAFQAFPSGKTKVKCTGMSEKFNPLQESCQTACVRACAEELKATVSDSDFTGAPLLAKVDAGSRKFVGLASEYHLYYCMMATSTCKQLQVEKLPKGQMVAVSELDSGTNPKTLWWAWCPDADTVETEDLLTTLTAATEHAGAIDFRTKLKLGSPGEQVKEEMEVAKRMWSGATSIE